MNATFNINSTYHVWTETSPSCNPRLRLNVQTYVWKVISQCGPGDSCMFVLELESQVPQGHPAVKIEVPDCGPTYIGVLHLSATW